MITKILTIIALGAFFFLSYGWQNHYTSLLVSVPNFYFPWERDISFIPWMIIPYMSSDIVFIVGFLACRNQNEVKTTAWRVLFLNVLSIIIYMLMPLQFVFHRPSIDSSFLAPLYQLLSFDKPFNQCPSLHISFGLVFWEVIRARTPRVMTWFVDIWFVLIALSTLTVYQHHVVDLIGGFVCGYLALRIFPNSPTVGEGVGKFRTFSRMEAFFSTIAIVFFSGFVGSTGIVSYFSGYCGFVFSSVAVAYRGKCFGIFNKRNGKFPLSKLVLFFPYLFLAKVNWLFHQRHISQFISKIDGDFYVGSRPTRSDFGKITLGSDAIIIDLSAEIAEAQPYLKMNYHHFPILDLATPSLRQLTEIITRIEEIKGVAQSSDLLIHCALGLSRSVLVSAALLIRRGHSASQSVSLIRMTRAKIYLPDDYQHLLGQFEESCRGKLVA
jgi:membrane-associated phospholipid phosphatase